MKTIEQTRRELFQHWLEVKAKEREARGLDEFTSWETTIMYGAFNAALDAVVIVLPEPHSTNGGDFVIDYDDCRTAIESTNLGLKII